MNTIEIGLGLLALNCMALFLIRRKPATLEAPASSPQPEVAWRVHDPHIHIVERCGEQITIVETLHGGMLDPSNHAKVGAVLAAGDPSRGIQWHGGERNIEWAKEEGNV